MKHGNTQQFDVEVGRCPIVVPGAGEQSYTQYIHCAVRRPRPAVHRLNSDIQCDTPSDISWREEPKSTRSSVGLTHSPGTDEDSRQRTPGWAKTRRSSAQLIHSSGRRDNTVRTTVKTAVTRSWLAVEGLEVAGRRENTETNRTTRRSSVDFTRSSVEEGNRGKTLAKTAVTRAFAGSSR